MTDAQRKEHDVLVNSLVRLAEADAYKRGQSMHVPMPRTERVIAAEKALDAFMDSLTYTVEG